MKIASRATAALLVALFGAPPASASFHEMQIEQVIGGIDSNLGVQAIQLRMRDSGQDELDRARLVVRNAQGASPIVLINFTTQVSNAGMGSRVLIGTSNLPSFTSPSVTPDYVLSNAIPSSYLAAGSLTFEDDGGTVYWRLSWGGAAYTGTGAGATTNDANGNFNPPFAGPLPSQDRRAVQFRFAASAASTTNANDYLLTASAATFTNNQGVSGTVHSVVGVLDAPVPLALGSPFPNPVRGTMTYTVSLPRTAKVRVDLLDFAGRRIRRLHDGVLPAGRNALEWDGRSQSGLANGVYLLAIETEGARRCTRLVLLRDGAAHEHSRSHHE